MREGVDSRDAAMLAQANRVLKVANRDAGVPIPEPGQRLTSTRRCG
jgi:hypothetical protein